MTNTLFGHIVCDMIKLLHLYFLSYLTGELRVDALDVSLGAIIPQLYANRSLQSHPNRPSHLFKGGNQLFSLLCTAVRVEDGPHTQWNLKVNWISW